jgi:very-short-patch-repair endonuclease
MRVGGHVMPERSFRSRAQTKRARELRRDVSKTENRLWPYLWRSAAGAPFRRQHPVGPFFPDYYCAPLKLVVEVDGPLHDAERDSRRDAWMRTRGITVLRFSVQEIEDNLEGVVSTIRDQVWLLKNGKQE